MLFRSRYLYKFYNYYGRQVFVLDMFQFQKKWYWFTANLGPEDGLMAFFQEGSGKQIVHIKDVETSRALLNTWAANGGKIDAFTVYNAAKKAGSTDAGLKKLMRLFVKLNKDFQK